MKHMAIMALTVASLGITTGCTSRYGDVPAPTRFENSDQLKVQAAGHWQVIAENFADRIVVDMRKTIGDSLVYIPSQEVNGQFVQGFRELLTTALVNRGVKVSTDGTNAFPIEINYTIYRFLPGRIQTPDYYTQTPEGQFQPREKYDTSPVPRSEVLITARIADGGRILLQRSQVYYVPDGDAALYTTNPPPAPTVGVYSDCEGGNAKCAR